jgi:DNA modification methylase
MTLREERIGNQRLILGDCLQVMPTLGRFDAVVTDPPYGIGGSWQGGSGKGWGKFGQKPPAWDMRPDWLTEWVAAFPGEAIIWGGNYFQGLPISDGWLIWDKGMADFTSGVAELAWTSLRQPIKRAFVPSTVMTPTGSDGQKWHRTQKPVALMEWCLGFLPDAKTILDPFMGSGTTLVACQRMGRHGTGIELDPDYFDIACRRVDEAARQPDLLIPETRQAPTQEAMDL